jgi:hypothetical protein
VFSRAKFSITCRSPLFCETSDMMTFQQEAAF